MLKDIINKPQSDYLLQNFLEIDSGSKVNFYLNYLLENNGSIELDRIYPIYASVIHHHNNEIVFAYFISRLIDFIKKEENQEKIIPMKPLDFTYLLMCKMYYTNSDGAKYYYDILTNLIRSCLAQKNTFIEYVKPRVAICFFGILRGDWELSIKENIKNVAQALNADCFLFSWDEEQLWPSLGGGGNWIERKFDANFAKKIGKIGDKIFLFDNFRHTFLKLDSEYLKNLSCSDVKKIKQYFKNIKLEKQSNLNLSSSVEKFYYGIYQSFEVMKEYERLYNFQYDFVISTRVDVDILLNESCIKNFYEMKFYEICDSHIGDGTGTGCVFGGREAMEKYTSLYCYMDKLKGRFVNYKLDNHEMFFKFNIYKNIKNVFVNLLQINIWGKTRVGNGYYFPNIKNELKMDIEKLENKFSKQEIDSFIKSFSIVEKRFKPMSSNVKVFNKHTGLVSNNYKIPLSYIIGSKLIKSSKKSYFYLFKSLITLAYFSKKYKINPEYTTDYETLKKYKNSFSFKVGSQFINAHKNWYKGGYIKFIFKDIPRLKREFDNKKYKL
ncbi:hypothetical protein OEI73_001874 [Campylobacter jejuni]|uniref:hypothetical protein n=1 Tax=Campylobacter jejuni TaxID=197 RepID=UPI001CB4EA1E|nr:hypothetical protein [Campylobacter jejuni]EFU4967595.1 hypothetical protein [Campylobacter jejuni]EHQ1657306.1 hypothetical protein [Campylobacter jejuni]EIY6496592.1 hypothetical protein [Campylobacter jejuni]EIZ0657945.1 hypothetical protein [Campylobacter jejuni]EJF0731729.1 hypothetical protein [Campylobacter jejuni]